MTPLDLTKHRPRACADVSLGGTVMLARTIDKVRAELPGGELGVYFVLKDGAKTLSGGLFRVFHIDADEFRRVVADAPDDAAVERWFLERAPSEKIATWNERIRTLSLGDLDAEGRATFHRNNPGTESLPDSEAIIAILDAWDEAHWSTTAQ
jgi:hypothetical protein